MEITESATSAMGLRSVARREVALSLTGLSGILEAIRTADGQRSRHPCRVAVWSRQRFFRRWHPWSSRKWHRRRAAAPSQLNGWAADRYGPKIVMMIAIVALTGFIFLSVFATSLPMLVVAEILCGIPWGIFQTLTTAYASEVCPIQLRGYLTACEGEYLLEPTEAKQVIIRRQSLLGRWYSAVFGSSHGDAHHRG
jgi:hypothetical protein